jgi:mannosyltransferase
MSVTGSASRTSRDVSERRFWLGVALAAGVALVGAGATLAREPLWNDELASLSIVDRSFGALLREFPHEHNGMLFYVALWPVVHLGGTSVAWLRLPAMVSFALAVVVCGLVGRRLAGATVGVAAATLLAVNPYAVRYAQEARMYGFALLFALVAVWALLRAVERPSRLHWAGYALAVTAAGYSHDFTLLTVAAHPILVRRSPLGVRRGFAAALGGAALLLAPLAALAATDWGTQPLAWVSRPGPRAVEGFALAAAGSWPGVFACIGLLAAVGLALKRRGSPHRPGARELAFLVAWLVAPFLVLVLISQAKPLLVYRYLLPSIPALCLLLGASLAVLAPRAAFVGLALVALSFVAYTAKTDVERTNPDFPGAAAYIDAHLRPSELVATAGGLFQNANGLLYYGVRGRYDPQKLVWSDADAARLPSYFRLIHLDGTARLTTRDIAGLIDHRPGMWVVIRGGFVSGSKLAPLYRWADRCRGRPQTFRGLDLLHLLPCPLA